MPELPEVETVARSLNKKVRGQKILSVWTSWPRHFSRSPGGFTRFAREAKGKVVLDVSRRGKRIIFRLNGGKLLVAHLKMTGIFLWGVAGEGNKFTRMKIVLSRGTLYFSDIRKFGRFIFGDVAEVESSEDVKNIGPDPFSATAVEFERRLRARRGGIKNTLLNQVVVSGIGNIYADEILHRTHIHPLTEVERLSSGQISGIRASAIKILKHSIAAGGTSMRDFRNTEGKPGGYITLCRAYGREGESCLFRCGGKIVRLKLGARSAHFCPKCQKQSGRQ